MGRKKEISTKQQILLQSAEALPTTPNGQAIVKQGDVFINASVAGGLPSAEIPGGSINGINTVFTLVNTPIAGEAVVVLIDGVTQYYGIDYSVSGTTITFNFAPTTGSSMFVYYNKASAGGNNQSYWGGVTGTLSNQTDLQNALDGKADISSVYTTTQSDLNYEPKNSNIQTHIASTSNPHSTNKTQIGLSNVPNLDATIPSNITQDSTHRFVTDAEKALWNASVVGKGTSVSTDTQSIAYSIIF